MSLARLGNNIRCIRVAYGETQEQLGFIIGVEKTTISQYENGRREPSRDILNAIAEHYVISVEELMQCDLSHADKIVVDQNVLWREIDVILPIVSSENALINEHFKKAHQLHVAIFDDLKKISMDMFDKIGDCLEEYDSAYDDDISKTETAANIWGILILMLVMLKVVPDVMEKKPAPIRQIMARDRKAAKIVEESDSSFKDEADEILKDFDDPEFNEMLSEIKTLLKQSSYSILADYYLALEYCWNIVDNGLTREFNARIGVEMMNTFVSVGNPYAAHFILFSRRSMGMVD